MAGRRKGKLVVLHLAVRYPLAGVVWQLLHHLVGFRRLGLEVYYVEDHGAYVYDPLAETVSADPSSNLKRVRAVLERFGFGDRWSFLDPVSHEYLGMGRERTLELIGEADAVINLCGATEAREEHVGSRCLVYLETDPGGLQAGLLGRDPQWVATVSAHKVFFTYGYNIGADDCRIPACGLKWHPTRPPVLLDQWRPGIGPAAPAAFTTVGTWRNYGKDVAIGGEEYQWSKHINFSKMLRVARLAGQPIELATDLDAGPEYERGLAGGFTFRPAIPMSLDLDGYRDYIAGSRGEFTAAKDLVARTCSGWFSDRTACYLAAGRPVVTQYTGFEKYLPAGSGLLGFDDEAGAVEALRAINADYPRHAAAAREIAREYFDAEKLLDAIASRLGL